MNEVPMVKRVLLRIEHADGECLELDYPKPYDVEIEHASRNLPTDWVPVRDAIETGLPASAPERVSIRFKAAFAGPESNMATMRTWTSTGSGAEDVLAAFVKATGWSYQEALDRAAAATVTQPERI